VLSNPPLRIGLGCVLLALVVLGATFAIGRPVIRATHRQVKIGVFNNSSIVQIFVNCRQAAWVPQRRIAANIDLGWLQSDDRVFVSATSRDALPSYGFLGLSNGKKFFEAKRGSVEVLGFPAEPNAVVFAKGFLASGAPLGNTGCQFPAVVAVPDYVQSPADDDAPAVEGDKPSYRPKRSPYAQIDAIGSWILIPLAAIGLLAALAIGPIRRLSKRHWEWVAGASALLAAVVALFFGPLGPAALFTTLKIGGTLLLFAVAFSLTVPTLWRRLKRAAGTGGSQG
jgi:hypothetical protein